MRIGLHYGPIYVGSDRVTAADLWYGGEVNRTARIEPVTPIGDVYCTEPFASALILDGVDDLKRSRSASARWPRISESSGSTGSPPQGTSSTLKGWWTH